MCPMPTTVAILLQEMQKKLLSCRQRQPPPLTVGELIPVRRASKIRMRPVAPVDGSDIFDITTRGQCLQEEERRKAPTCDPPPSTTERGRGGKDISRKHTHRTPREGSLLLGNQIQSFQDLRHSLSQSFPPNQPTKPPQYRTGHTHCLRTVSKSSATTLNPRHETRQRYTTSQKYRTRHRILAREYTYFLSHIHTHTYTYTYTHVYVHTRAAR